MAVKDFKLYKYQAGTLTIYFTFIFVDSQRDIPSIRVPIKYIKSQIVAVNGELLSTNSIEGTYGKLQFYHNNWDTQYPSIRLYYNEQQVLDYSLSRTGSSDTSNIPMFITDGSDYWVTDGTGNNAFYEPTKTSHTASYYDKISKYPNKLELGLYANPQPQAYIGNNYVASGYIYAGAFSTRQSQGTTSLAKDILGKGSEVDMDDPQPGGGDSKPGGGGGDGDIGGDTNPDDGLPTISALDSGLLTAYNPTVGELQSLGKFLWSDSFDITTFKKLFNDPFDTLLGLSVVPVKPNTSGTKTIMFGNMDSGVSSAVVSNQWVSKDMGSVTLNEVWKGALDYAPSTGVTIYLPFIGMRQLNVNDVMGSTLHLIYKFDVLTGACVAQIYVNHSSQGNKDNGFSWTKNQGLVYEFIGQCSENIPLASQDFTNTIRAAIGGVSVAAGAAASVATGNPALGMAALTVGMANSGMQASTPTVERGGHLSGSAAIMGYSQPFLIVERPHQCKPSRYYALRGVPSQVYTSKLSNCTGFTQITANNNIHIAGASDAELTELQNLLVSGVYFPDKKR